MSNLSLKGIVIGGVVDVALSGILGALLVGYVMATHGLTHVSSEQLQGSLIAIIHDSPVLFGIQLLIGFGCSVLGGYVAARLSRERLLLNGALASWLCVGIGIYSLSHGTGMGSMAFGYAAIVLTPACYVLGAALRKRSLGNH